MESPFLLHTSDFFNLSNFCTLETMGYFITNILVYGFLFALIVVGYNAIRKMKNK